jgi:hypothetical protein
MLLQGQFVIRLSQSGGRQTLGKVGRGRADDGASEFHRS